LTKLVTNGNITYMTGEELKTLRTRLGLTQNELRKRLGVARVTVARWEIGLRRVPELAARLVQHVAKEVREERQRKKSRRS
jgi:DNA-binding transcriptional regulator YiaG